MVATITSLNDNFDKMLLPIRLLAQFLTVPAHSARFARIRPKNVYCTTIFLIFYTCLTGVALEAVISLPADKLHLGAIKCYPRLINCIRVVQVFFDSFSVYSTLFLYYINYNKINQILMEIRNIDNNIRVRFGNSFFKKFKYRQLKRKALVILVYLQFSMWIFPLWELPSMLRFPITGKVLILRALMLQFDLLITFEYLFYAFLLQQRFVFCNNLLLKSFLKSRSVLGHTFFITDNWYRNPLGIPTRNSQQTKLMDHKMICDYIFEIHNNCYELCNKLNYLHGFQILLILITSFLDCLMLSHRIFCRGLAQISRPIPLVHYLVLTLVKLFVITKILNDTALKANYTKIILQRVRNKIIEVREYVSRL